MSIADSKNRAVELVKEALGHGVLTPAASSDWLYKPEEYGEKLGKFIGAAVKATVKELESM
ncbi:hypothetical protein [Burkholderia gladioli]|uniref:hypothetical protein n=1 Tax=Burkholderia gladioli TaxID=28095 RepID=UPI00163EE82C|nr:hypothetical protein [Burkholderia gladioli]